MQRQTTSSEVDSEADSEADSETDGEADGQTNSEADSVSDGHKQTVKQTVRQTVKQTVKQTVRRVHIDTLRMISHVAAASRQPSSDGPPEVPVHFCYTSQSLAATIQQPPTSVHFLDCPINKSFESEN